MSGGGGGSSGQVSYPDYLQTFHRDLLNNGESEFLSFSLVDAMNSAHNASPYTGVTVTDPTGYTNVVQDTSTRFGTAIAGFDNITDYQAAYAAALALCVVDTAPLENNETDTSTLQSNTTDIAVLDTAITNTVDKDTAPTKDVASAAITYTPTAVTALTPSPPIVYTSTPVDADSMPADEAAIAADVATYADILREQIENDVLPRYKAGMLNVNAITTSAFVIGEALIWAAYDRDVARYAAELRSKVFLQNGQYNSQFLLAASQQTMQSIINTQNVNAQENLAHREQETRYGLSASEQTNLRIIEAQRLTAAENLAEREEGSRYNTTFREENRAYVLAASDQNARFKIAQSGEATQLKIAFSEQTTRFKIASQETNTRLKLAYSDETVKLKLASSEQNTKYKLQKNELDAAHKLNRQKNVLLATAEMMRLFTSKIEFQRIELDESVKTAALLITSQNEQLHEQLVIDEADAKWNIELFQYAANLIASVSGGTNPNAKKQSKAVTALGGALSGAAAGAAVGGPYAPVTAAAGAVIGGVAGYLQ